MSDHGMKTQTQIHDEMGEELSQFGGFLRCEQCGATKPPLGIASYLGSGWPRHCGYTMRWWTQRQIDAGEVPVWPVAASSPVLREDGNR